MTQADSKTNAHSQSILDNETIRVVRHDDPPTKASSIPKHYSFWQKMEFSFFKTRQKSPYMYTGLLSLCVFTTFINAAYQKSIGRRGLATVLSMTALSTLFIANGRQIMPMIDWIPDDDMRNGDRAQI